MASILIIDDYEPFRRSLRALLQRAGHVVREAHNGAEGIASFLDQAPDLVIVDVFMPEKDGLETILDLRRINPTVGVIAVSGESFADYYCFLGVAKHLGATRVLPKPVQSAELFRIIAELLAPVAAEPSESSAAGQ
ncbi:MAG: response regulator [Verrucomicrobiota bacterium]